MEQRVALYISWQMLDQFCPANSQPLRTIDEKFSPKTAKHCGKFEVSLQIGGLDMSPGANNGSNDEAALVKLYMEITGADEAHARSVLMYLTPPRHSQSAEKPVPGVVRRLSPESARPGDKPGRRSAAGGQAPWDEESETS
jgi:hypothetical protein